MIHETPSEQIFNELKEAATNVWNTYDNTHGYVTEKLERINSISNYADNAMVCYRMFDANNQYKMKQMLSDEAKEVIKPATECPACEEPVKMSDKLFRMIHSKGDKGEMILACYNCYVKDLTNK